jgi:thiamine pyrophosphate-dependent acetolactate synthase large subunit-like protein
MVGFGDLATAARDHLPIIVAVMNDGRYGMVELGNRALYGRTPPYPCDDLDISSTAASLGIDVAVIEHASDLASWTRPASRSGPFVLDVRIDPAVRMPKPERFEDLRKTVSEAAHTGDAPRREVA